MSKKFLIDIDLNGNELQNFVVQNLATAPANPVAGRHYFNTTDHTEYFYDGTAWVNASGDYTFQNGIEQSGKNVQIKLGTSSNVTLTADSTGLYAEVADASTSAKGVIEIATDEEAATGTSETLAVNPKQLATKVDANTAITGATKCKITYDAKGLVTDGADLAESDIPELHLAKITDVTATAEEVNVLDGITATTAELNILDGVTADASEINILDGATLTTTELNYVDGVTSSIQDQLNAKLELDSLSVAAGSADYMTYDNTSGEFSLNVDTTPTADSTSLITSGGVKSYVDNKISTTYKAAGSVAFANLPTLGATYEGYVYNVSDAFTTTADFVEGAGNNYPAGTNVVCVNTATSGTAVYKWDVLAGFVDVSSFITATSTDTLENKTIDADNNTISNLETDNFKSGVIVTSIAAASTAADTKLPTEAAVRGELDGKQDLIASSTANDIVTVDGNGQVLDSRKAFVTSIDDSASADNNSIPTELAVATFVENSIAGAKAEYKNTAITVSSGTATWSLSNLPADPMSIVIIETATSEEVCMKIVYGTKSATISWNSSADVAANTYTAKVLF